MPQTLTSGRVGGNLSSYRGKHVVVVDRGCYLALRNAKRIWSNALSGTAETMDGRSCVPD